jgi:2-keto-4-pentenoate hydratase/2-oxohepta-3-ene-1,7-dioic acid hydratase in catechol pathway
MLDGHAHWGVLTGEDIAICDPRRGLPQSVLDLIALGGAAGEVLRTLMHDASARRVRQSEVELLAPIPRPSKNIICMGLNYVEHVRESLAAKGRPLDLPEHPVVFTKNVTSVNGPFADVPLDGRATQQLDWEAELAFVIGRGGRHIPEANALEHVFGYMVLNDLSARDVQFRHKQFFLGKSLDGTCPMGPYLVTADEIADPQALAVRCWVNGELKQDGNTKDQQFSIARTIAVLSQVMTLEPGDIVSTGTPDGVGFARKPPEFLTDGDVVECEVSGIGRIRNRIVAV